MLGISLINKCIQEKIEVLAIIRPNSDRKKTIPTSPLVKIIECSSEDLLSLKFDDKYDVFYHFAWKATSHETRNDPISQSDNIQDTLHAMQFAAKIGCKTFIGAGSQAEYGRVSSTISPETPVNPDNSYGISKYATGKLCAIKGKELGMRFIWTRVFSVYGPHDGSNTMISTCIRKLKNDESMELTPCEQEWDYLYEDDCAKAFYLLGLKGQDQTTYCIGSGQTKSLKQYTQIIGEILNKSNMLKIGAKPYIKDQVMFLKADITLLTKHTGFIPEISFEEGIRSTIF